MGALGGGLITMLTSLLTLRSSQRAEAARWQADHRWEYSTGLADARRVAYARFLSQQNAIIMAAAGTRDEVLENGQVLHHMPPAQAAVYQELEDSWAQSLLLASPPLRALLLESHNYLNGLVWASWEGRTVEARETLYEDVLAAMRAEVVEQPLPGPNVPQQS